MGISKNIKTPDEMWGYFISYKNEVKGNPIIIQDFVGKDADEVERKKEKPLTFIGFQNWLDDNDIITDVTDYFENKDKRYSDFVRICSRIKRNIQNDQITGGMVGIYNTSITQRLNHLTDRTDLTTDGKPLNNEPITIKITKPLEESD